MNKIFPLQSVLDFVADLKLEEATRRLGELVSGERRASERLGLLIQYRDEYQARFLDAARDGLGREQWRKFSEVPGALDTAISQAKELLSESHQLTTSRPARLARSSWAGSRIRHAGAATSLPRRLRGISSGAEDRRRTRGTSARRPLEDRRVERRCM